jgi:hypothetical protein
MHVMVVVREWVLEPNLFDMWHKLRMAINHPSRTLLLQIHLSGTHCQILAIKTMLAIKTFWLSKIIWPRLKFSGRLKLFGRQPLKKPSCSLKWLCLHDDNT